MILNILAKACPANILANNRIDKLRTRTLYEISSKIIKNHDIAKGEPVGKNKFANFEFWIANAMTFKPQNDCIPKYKVVNAKLVKVKLYGIIPNKLNKQINVNTVNK